MTGGKVLHLKNDGDGTKLILHFFAIAGSEVLSDPSRRIRACDEEWRRQNIVATVL
jgi:hypothetical protein